MTREFTPLDLLCVNTLRTLSIDAIQHANSGHPGLPLGAAPMAYVLWQRHLRVDPSTPDWPDRDRFVLSGGHGSMLLYALLHLSGFDLSLEEIKSFRQWGSSTPGHPEFGLTPGVEATTGPLGQGTANAVGMAMTERWLAARFNRDGHPIVDHHTYALVTDGDLMEGISAEAASLAGRLGLGKLIYLYDSNDVTLDGPASLSFTEDVAARYEACGWHVERVDDGDRDLAAIDSAIEKAKTERSRPSLIVVKTTIGYGSPHKAGSHVVHGAPLGAEEVVATKRALGWPFEDEFRVPDEAREHFATVSTRGNGAKTQWEQRFSAYEFEHPELARQWQQALAGELPSGWDAELPRFDPGGSLATRVAAGKVLQTLADRIPWLLGGDADLSSSTKTHLADCADFGDGDGRNIHFGVREHAMGAIVNGMLYHGGVRPFASTFFCFSDYMRPALRLAALSHLGAIYVWTHDSVGVGEDGPTHQPVEHLMSLRAVPNLYVLRPGDADEAREAWVEALRRTDGPTALVLSRQSLPAMTGEHAKGLHRGAYVLREPLDGPPQGILIATGSELSVALEAAQLLAEEGLEMRVVSMPCFELFAEQPTEYRESILPTSIVARVSIEAGVSLGWERWIGTEGRSVALDRFGASAPAGDLFEHLGMTVARVVETMKSLL